MYPWSGGDAIARFVDAVLGLFRMSYVRRAESSFGMDFRLLTSK